MSDALDPTRAAGLPDTLYSVLPPLFRADDIGQGYPLLALSAVFDAVRAEIGDAIDALEHAWFAETCPERLVPLLGALFGADLGDQPIAEHRALVADLLGARRRKGIAAALPRLIHGQSGWCSVYSLGPATPPAAWPLAAPFAPSPLPTLSPTPSPAPPPATGDGGGELRVWRKPAFAITAATPATLSPGRFAFNPAGLAQPLANAPNTSLDWVAAPPVTALPVALTVAMLAHDLTRWRSRWGDQGPPDSLLYGTARGLAIHVQPASTKPWQALGPEQVRAVAIGDGAVPPDYPVLRGGVLTPATQTATTERLALTLGDGTTAQLAIAIPAAPTMAQLVTAVQNAIAAAPVTLGKTWTEADVRAIQVGAAGSQLVLVPPLAITQPLTLAPIAAGTDPLLIVGQSATGTAATTLPLDTAMLAALTGAPGSLGFTTPDGQAVAAAVPLTGAATPAGVAGALAAAIPNSAAFVVGDQVVIVLTSGPATLTPPPPTPLATAIGLTPLVAIDPERGLFAWPGALPAPPALAVDYAAMAAAAVGGLDGAAQPPHAAVSDQGIATELGTLFAANSASGGTMRLQGSATRPVGAVRLNGPWLLTGDAGARPCVAVPAPGALTIAGELDLANLLFAGSIALAAGDSRIRLDDMTLLPPQGDAIAAASTTPVSTGTIALAATRSILGPVDLTGFTGSVTLTDSVISTPTAPDRAATVLTAPPKCRIRLERTTVIGGVAAGGELIMHDSLCDGVLTCEGTVTITMSAIGGLRTPGAAPVPAGSAPEVTWCGTCDKPVKIALPPALIDRLYLRRDDLCRCKTPAPAPAPACETCDGSCPHCPLHGGEQRWSRLKRGALTSEAAYPFPDFATLSPDADPQLRTAASNRDELGVYNRDVPTARQAGFERALRDGLLVGVRPAVRYES